MMDERVVLEGLLKAYVEGDTLARKVLLDFLEETGDSRLDDVRSEAIDWDALTQQLPHRWSRGMNYARWLIDCARFGSPGEPEVARAVSKARRDWLADLFPEIESLRDG